MKIILLVVVLCLGLITCINPIYPREQFLQHLGTLLILIIPAADLRSNRLSLLAYSCVMAFLIIHIIGARYIYSYVPYVDWINSLTNADLGRFLQSNRNHYDRFVHLAFGALAFPYLYELTRRSDRLSKVFRLLIAWLVIQSVSLLYEVFEWFLTFVMSADAAADYNGQQGDPWDAQKDMALALLSSSVLFMAYWFRKGGKK
ncbi:MAG: DUF2238 domain-containing protein [Bacteroidales bacterium]